MVISDFFISKNCDSLLTNDVEHQLSEEKVSSERIYRPYFYDSTVTQESYVRLLDESSKGEYYDVFSRVVRFIEKES